MFVIPFTPARHAVARHAYRPGYHRAIDRLFDERLDDGARVPALDVAESDSHYTLTLDLPGIAKEQVKVSVHGRQVSIEARQADPAPAKDGDRVLYRERSAPRFARQVTLPVAPDAQAAQARFDQGVLTVTLPKLQPVGAVELRID